MKVFQNYTISAHATAISNGGSPSLPPFQAAVGVELAAGGVAGLPVGPPNPSSISNSGRVSALGPLHTTGI